MNAIKPNLHNFIVIVLFAVLGFLLLKLANKRLSGVPVIGQLTSTAAAA